MRASRRISKKPIAEINVVPYVDVMLVLLVIFMITTPLLSQGVEIDLPQAQGETLNSDSEQPLIISINAKGDYFLNLSSHPESMMTAEALASRVAAELQLAQRAGQERTVLIEGDNQVDYGKVVQAMVLLQQAGAPSVGLMTQPSAKPRDLASTLSTND